MKLHHKLNLNKVLLVLLIILFGYSVSGAMFDIMGERTLGSIFRHFLPTTPYLFLITLISLYDIRRVSFSGLVPRLPSNINLEVIFKRLLWPFLLAVFVGWFSSQYLAPLGLLYLPVILAVIISLIVSCYCMLTERKVLAVILFFATIPFLFFIQSNLWQILDQVEFVELKISGVPVPLSAIYLSLI